MPSTWNTKAETVIKCTRGTSGWYSLQLLDGSNAPIDLTGATITMEVREGDSSGKPSSNGALAMRLERNNGLVITDADGLIAIRWTLEQADSLSASDSKVYFWDLKIVYGDGSVDRRPKEDGPGIFLVFEKITS